MNFTRLIFISLLSFSLNSYAQVNDSLEKVLKTNLADTTRVQVLNKLAFGNLVSNPKAAHEFAGEAVDLAEKIKYNKGIALSYLNRGRTFYFLSNYEKAIEYSFKSLTEYEKLNDKKGIAAASNNVGGLYYVQRSYTNANAFYQRALKLYEELGEGSSVGALLGNIGAIFYDQMKYDESLKYYYTALEKIKDDPTKLYTLSTTYGCIGNAYWGKKNFAKSIEYNLKALEIQKQLNDNFGIANSLTNIGGMYNDSHKPDLAINYLKKAIEAAQKYENTKALMTAHSFMSTSLEQKGDYKGSLAYHKAYAKMQDSIFNSESSAKMAEVLAKYETDKKDRERELIEKAKEEIQNAKLEKQQLMTTGISIVAILIFILLLFIFRSFKQKQKSNAIIIEQKKMVDEKQKEILDSIHYAKKIQTALMTSEKYIQKNVDRLSGHK